MKISRAFQAFSEKTPAHARAWGEMVQKLAGANVLDAKTTSLIYLGILAALGMENGIPYHVAEAKKSGATMEEILCAVLVGLPPAGHKVTQVLPLVVESFENENLPGSDTQGS